MEGDNQTVQQLEQAIFDIERNGPALEGTARGDALKKLKLQLAKSNQQSASTSSR